LLLWIYEILDFIYKFSFLISYRVKFCRSLKTLNSELKQIIEQLKSQEKEFGTREYVLTEFRRRKQAYDAASSEVINSQRSLKVKLKTFWPSWIIMLQVILFCLFVCLFFRKWSTWPNSAKSSLPAFVKVSCWERTMYSKLYWELGTLKYIFNFYALHQTRYWFFIHLSYQGQLKFDSDEKSLILMVAPPGREGTSQEPTAKRSRAAGTDIRSLSGGERSFATVCFILSLWDAIESPFRVLDEFDVFMVCSTILLLLFYRSLLIFIWFKLMLLWFSVGSR